MREQLAIVALQRDVGEEPVLFAQSGNGDDVAVVTLEGDNPFPCRHPSRYASSLLRSVIKLFKLGRLDMI